MPGLGDSRGRQAGRQQAAGGGGKNLSPLPSANPDSISKLRSRVLVAASPSPRPVSPQWVERLPPSLWQGLEEQRAAESQAAIRSEDRQ
jgi:hypothetical protein